MHVQNGGNFNTVATIPHGIGRTWRLVGASGILAVSVMALADDDWPDIFPAAS
jgi:hypothetical protein